MSTIILKMLTFLDSLKTQISKYLEKPNLHVHSLYNKGFSFFIYFLKLEFTPCKAEQPLRGMELQEKEAQKDYSIQEICLERTYS